MEEGCPFQKLKLLYRNLEIPPAKGRNVKNGPWPKRARLPSRTCATPFFIRLWLALDDPFSSRLSSLQSCFAQSLLYPLPPMPPALRPNLYPAIFLSCIYSPFPVTQRHTIISEPRSLVFLLWAIRLSGGTMDNKSPNGINDNEISYRTWPYRRPNLRK